MTTTGRQSAVISEMRRGMKVSWLAKTAIALAVVAGSVLACWARPDPHSRAEAPGEPAFRTHVPDRGPHGHERCGRGGRRGRRARARRPRAGPTGAVPTTMRKTRRELLRVAPLKGAGPYALKERLRAGQDAERRGSVCRPRGLTTTRATRTLRWSSAAPAHAGGEGVLQAMKPASRCASPATTATRGSFARKAELPARQSHAPCRLPANWSAEE